MLFLGYHEHDHIKFLRFVQMLLHLYSGSIDVRVKSHQSKELNLLVKNDNETK